ncbi:MAG: mannosyltransferase [Lysobacteraceae bacterium]|nr:MAG: mannosyltransferase [Xanthomonadaceae bacterium]
MRILHLGKYFPPYHGGIERFVDDLSAAQAGSGHQVSILAHSGSRSHSSQRLADGRSLYQVATYGQLFFAPIAPRFGAALRQAVEEHDPDVLHVHVPNTSAFLVNWIAAANRIPMVLHWHSDVLPDGGHRRLRMAYPFYKPFESRLLKHASAIIATSPPYAKASTPLSEFADKVHTVPLGLDPDSLAATKSQSQQSPWPKPGLRLLFIGRDTHYKGLDLLLQALQQEADASLVVIGQQGQDSEQVRFLGQVDDETRNQILAQCDATCLPSRNRHEAFGMVLIESAALGKPVIAADIQGSGAPWVVSELQNGVLFTPDDADSLRARITEFRSEPFRTRLAKLGRQNVAKKFHIDTVRQRIDDIYRQILQ